MALADRLNEAPKRRTGNPCSVGDLENYLQSQGGEEADAFHAMLHTLGWSGRRIFDEVQAEAKVLHAAGNFEAAAIYAAMAEQTVNRHRSRGCRCYK